MSGGILATPIIGTWLHWLVFGGEFPGTEIIPRFYALHILLIPGIILALIAVHVGLVCTRSTPSSPACGARRATSSACASCRYSRSRPADSLRSWSAYWR